MNNRSHFNSGHITLNALKESGVKHSSFRQSNTPNITKHIIAQADCIDFLKTLPDRSVQLILIDPPYNIDIATWDSFDNYIEWASKWIYEVERVLDDTGNFVVFGGIQFKNEQVGDLLELMHFIRHKTNLKMVNLIIWYYKNGMSAHRFFANRHEEIVWYVKSKKYTFNLDEVRIPFDEKTKKAYMSDKRLNPESIEKGKNPTNVWEIKRLNGNSKERVGHPTQKPSEIIERLVKALSNPGDIVLDFFAGSGSTTKVCIEQNRHSISVDIDESLKYFLNKHLEKINLFHCNSYELLTTPDSFKNHPIFNPN
jgi:site-specific DNA-methyltransferase (adenine-specific)